MTKTTNICANCQEPIPANHKVTNCYYNGTHRGHGIEKITTDKKYYQSICNHNFKLDTMIGEMTWETCTICKLNISRFPKKNIPSMTAKITSVEGNVWDVLVQTN